MLILKLATVPLFIAIVTLAGHRWGSRIAGLLGGFPIVAGPIVILVALEQGPAFGAVVASSAISAVAGIMVFGIAYCWASIRWIWPVALVCSLGAWGLAALGLAALPSGPEVALIMAIAALALAPHLLPKGRSVSTSSNGLRDLPYRMLTGALLTLLVTSMAAGIGETWSGILSVFPVIALVLAVFTHKHQGACQVAQVFTGMVRGLYSFIGFFLVLTLLWPYVEFWRTCWIALCVSVALQAAIQYGVSLKQGQ